MIRNNPTWTIDPEYYSSPYGDRTRVYGYSNYSYDGQDSLFKSEPKFVSSFKGPKFTRAIKNQIGF